MLATYIWVGNNNGNPLYWSKNYNWLVGGATPATPPGAADDVVLNLSGATDSIIDTGFTGTVNSLFISNTYKWNLKLAKNFTVSSTTGGTSEFQGATITQTTGPFALTIAEPLTWDGAKVTGGITLATSNTTTINPGQNATSILDGATLSNTGTVNVTQGTFDIRNGGTVTNSGQFNVSGGTITNSAGMSTFTNTGTLTVSSALTVASFTNQGSFNLNTGGTATFTGSATQSNAGSSTTFSGGSLTVPSGQGALGYNLTAGTLTGSTAGSTITGNVTNSGAVINTGGTTGKLTITGNYTQQGGGTLVVGVDFTANTNSSLAVGGTISLAGSLQVNFSGTDVSGSTWSIITYGATAGTDFGTLLTNGPTLYPPET